MGDNTAEELRKLKNHVDEAQARIEDKVDKKIAERDSKIERRLVALETCRPSGTPKKLPTDRRREEAFLKCRRSLKVWPVRGEDLVDAFKVFLSVKLGFDDQRIGALGEIVVTKANGKVARDRSEVLVLFEDRETRDQVKAAGPNLATDRTSGMALHVPGHLLDHYYALNSLGYNIKSTHQGVKRSVKFDDANMDLFLDICINDQWKRILPGEAKEALKAAPLPATGGSRSLTVGDLAALIQGEPVAGLTAVVVPSDEHQDQQQQQ